MRHAKSFPELKPCQHCGKLMRRHLMGVDNVAYNEPPHKYLARKFCNNACRGEGRIKKVPQIVGDKACAVCKKTFNRRRHPNGTCEPLVRYKRRVTCSIACLGMWKHQVMVRKLPSPLCEVCGVSIAAVIKPWEWQTPLNVLPPKHYLSRRFCSNPCRGIAQRVETSARGKYREKNPVMAKDKLKMAQIMSEKESPREKYMRMAKDTDGWTI